MKEVLELFIDKSEKPLQSREWMGKPFKQNGLIIATNAICLIAITDKGDNNYEILEKPNCSSVLELNHPCSHIININDLETKVNNATPDIEELLITHTTCKKCHGEGGEECSLDHWHECEDCEDGEVEHVRRTGKKTKDADTHYKLDGSIFSHKYISILIESCKLLGFSEIEKVGGGPINANVFKKDDVTIVLMPVREHENAIQI